MTDRGSFFNCPCVTNGSCILGNNTMCSWHWRPIISMQRLNIYLTSVFATWKELRNRFPSRPFFFFSFFLFIFPKKKMANYRWKKSHLFGSLNAMRCHLELVLATLCCSVQVLKHEYYFPWKLTDDLWHVIRVSVIRVTCTHSVITAGIVKQISATSHQRKESFIKSSIRLAAKQRLHLMEKVQSMILFPKIQFQG